MNEDYLWDRSGPPDPDVQRLEQALAPLRYRHRSELLQAPKQPAPSPWWPAAAAAVLISAVALGLQWQAPQPGPALAWQVDSVQGEANLGRNKAATSMAVRAGEQIRTGKETELTLWADEFGKLSVGSDSLLRATTTGNLTLERGTLHALIWAPPRKFVVDTPSARAIDLGCEYTITTDASGNGLLRVFTGWVAFRNGDLESFIPAGAACVTRKRTGPGIPFYRDASDQLRRALDNFERGDRSQLGPLLAAARPQDAITVWHLLTRVPAEDRAKVFDRFAGLVELPKEIRREDVLRRNSRAIDLCWNALNLEDTDWWRGWER